MKKRIDQYEQGLLNVTSKVNDIEPKITEDLSNLLAISNEVYQAAVVATKDGTEKLILPTEVCVGNPANNQTAVDGKSEFIETKDIGNHANASRKILAFKADPKPFAAPELQDENFGICLPDNQTPAPGGKKGKFVGCQADDDNEVAVNGKVDRFQIEQKSFIAPRLQLESLGICQQNESGSNTNKETAV